jgi:uncharacterized integral membrane protein
MILTNVILRTSRAIVGMSERSLECVATGDSKPKARCVDTPERGRRVKTSKLILLLVLVATVSAVVLQNQASWEVRFLWMTGNVPGVVLLFLTAAAGFVVGTTVTLLMKREPRP